ncbi:MAG: 50S ribosomal protein L1 [Candidatus Saccharimonadales bacterium]
MAEAKKTTKTTKTAKTVKTTKASKEEIKDDGNSKEVSKAPVTSEDRTDQEVAPKKTTGAATTKAGKHSAKAQQEAADKEAKELRKSEVKDEAADSKPKQKQNPSRSQLERKGKNYRKLAELIDKDKQYSLSEALDLAIKTNPAKFDAALELHVRLGVDPRHADQNIRDMVVLPAGTGKSIRVAVMADAEGAAAAKKAGAEIVGEEAVMALLEKGNLDFDILVSQPTLMAKLGKYARVLGPKGLMPNPKSGTVGADVAKAVTEAKAGRVEYRVDSTGIVHLAVGKVSFGQAKLLQNAKAVFASLKSAKPASIKGNYVLAIFVTTTMGPSVSVVTSEI